VSDAEDAADADVAEDWACYRHPYETAGVKCTRCDRPICPTCMITAPVGFQCPECVKGAPPVKRYSELKRSGAQAMVVTSAIIAVNATIFLVTYSRQRQTLIDYGLNGFAVGELGEWYRMITSGFLHFNLMHIGFNMLILFQLGQMLEPAFGRVRYALVYFTSLLGGSVGALLLSPEALTAGASGAVFGLMAATAVALQRRGVNVFQTSIGSLLIINIVLTFFISNVSIGGHLGGLLAGGAAGLIVTQTEDRPKLGTVLVAMLGAALFGAGILIA
jgi:membrane associated rhomboid family serine protease